MSSEVTIPFRDDRSTTAAVGVIGFTILVYDHIITFPEEVSIPKKISSRPYSLFDSQVEYIWLKKKQKRELLSPY